MTATTIDNTVITSMVRGLEFESDTRYFELESTSNLLNPVPRQRERLARHQGASFTVLVTGESGTGKSTFIRSLFGWGYTSSGSGGSSGRGGPTSTALHKPGNEPKRVDIHRTAEIDVRQVTLNEDGFNTKLTVVDTPGFGDYTNNENSWVPISNYIDAQHRYYMLQEEQPNREKLENSRVHLCLYFLAPSNRILDLDIAAMKDLSTRVNLIPVIGKSDSLTPRDRIAFKELVRSTVKSHNITVWSPKHPNTPRAEYGWPFAVVASDDLTLTEDGRRVRGREYSWGVVEVDNPKHSDFSILRELLIGEYMLDLIDDTHSLCYRPQRRNLRLFRLGAALNLNPDGTYRNNFTNASAEDELGVHKLAPADRPSVSFMIPNRTQITRDVTEEAATSMTSLEVLSIISKIGVQYLESEWLNQDTVLRQRAQALKSQFDVVTKFQQERFAAQSTELQNLRDELADEINQSTAYNTKLAEEINALEADLKRRR